jgi:hypothetical protein
MSGIVSELCIITSAASQKSRSFGHLFAAANNGVRDAEDIFHLVRDHLRDQLGKRLHQPLGDASAEALGLHKMYAVD